MNMQMYLYYWYIL